MLEHYGTAVLTRGLTEHPAVKAWALLRPQRAFPEGVEALKETGKSAVYRLLGVGPGGTAVVAKRRRRRLLETERLILQEILPQIPVPSLRFDGFVEDDGSHGWLFLEDGGREPYVPSSERHRALAARWLGRLHAAATRFASGTGLPDRGPGHYLGHLRASVAALRAGADDPSLAEGDRAVVRSLAARLCRLDANWGRVVCDCAAAPLTLVHGDFVGKNVCVRARPEGEVVLPFDWETAGIGAPAADLAQYAVVPDGLADYGDVVAEAWGPVPPAELRRWAWQGRVFRYVAAIDWACAGPAGWRAERAVRLLRGYAASLDRALRALEWEG
jgi:hypothetical protein